MTMRDERLLALVKKAWLNIREDTLQEIAHDMISLDEEIANLADGDPDGGDLDYQGLSKEIIALLPAVLAGA